ncbi:MAG: amidohydrolase family protein [Acidimicrobiia bacterium]
MEFDLVIRNGTVVDGSGGPSARGDVAIVDGKIATVGEVDGAGHEEIDADGLVVAPGFVDGHTHMDAQVFWDDLGTSSCWHGVTTAVMGNCGFTLAPASADQSGLVVRNLERAEDISGDAMAKGITWTWSTFREYLAAVDGLPKGLNYAAAIGHSALRTWAMGERAFTDAATPEDLAVMEAELSDALRAGAVGFSTSRSDQHETSDDRAVASRLATWDEVRALVGLVGRESEGLFQLTSEKASFDPDPAVRAEYYGRLRDLAVETKVPIAFGLFAIPNGANTLPLMEETAALGGQMYGLTHCRGVAVVLSFKTRLPFDNLPEWKQLRTQSLDAQRAALLDPEVRARLVHEANHADYGRAIGAEARKPDWNVVSILRSPYLPNPSVAEEAARRGIDPVELVIELALESDFDQYFVQMLTQQPEDELMTILRSPYSAMTFSDAGAHVSQILDCSIQTHLLAYWVRERQMLSIEEAIPMITRKPAEMWRLHDRGLLRAGMAGDVTIIDMDRVAPDMPEVVNDLPGGSRRLTQTAQGYVATIVNGEVLTRDGKATEARPGRLLRGTSRV